MIEQRLNVKEEGRQRLTTGERLWVCRWAVYGCPLAAAWFVLSFVRLIGGIRPATESQAAAALIAGGAVCTLAASIVVAFVRPAARRRCVRVVATAAFCVFLYLVAAFALLALNGEASL